MKAFADTNWLVAVYFIERDEDRAGITERYGRKNRGPYTISEIVLLECQNVFGRITRKARPPEWQRLSEDIGKRLRLEITEWPSLRTKASDLLSRYCHKGEIGTFDTTLVASALLAGATHFLSFDERIKALAAAERLKVFPELTEEGKAMLARLRST